ncbi:hypothetical protein DL98DRAFT_203660 [Cadophora sp. DSE1049]|nr:hypothetical protein DL98DRAFT_203660 [Cadophora sp. DSE1049]
MAPANLEKHPKMQATVEDFEDVDPADDVPLKENESPRQDATMRDPPTGEVPSNRADTASIEGSGATNSQPTASTLPDSGLTLDEMVSRLESLPSIKPFLLKCQKCNKIEPSEGAFKKCRCKAIVYCGRDCRKKDHREHKDNCGRLGNRSSEIASQTVQTIQAQREASERGFTVGLRQSLESATPEQAMKHWIDAFRLWVQDDKDAMGNCQDADKGLLEHFKDFLGQLKKQERHWAPWLRTKQGRMDCMALAKDKGSWYYIERRVTAKELQEYWGDIFPQYAPFLRHLKKIAHGEMVSAE